MGAVGRSKDDRMDEKVKTLAISRAGFMIKYIAAIAGFCQMVFAAEAQEHPFNTTSISPDSKMGQHFRNPDLGQHSFFTHCRCLNPVYAQGKQDGLGAAGKRPLPVRLSGYSPALCLTGTERPRPRISACPGNCKKLYKREKTGKQNYIERMAKSLPEQWGGNADNQ